jgi:hypothetical protein
MYMGEVHSFRGEPERRGPLGRSKQKWEDNGKWDFKEIGPI